MYRIAAGRHPLSDRRFPTRSGALAIAAAWGMGAWRVRLDLVHPRREVGRVPSAH